MALERLQAWTPVLSYSSERRNPRGEFVLEVQSDKAVVRREDQSTAVNLEWSLFNS